MTPRKERRKNKRLVVKLPVRMSALHRSGPRVKGSLVFSTHNITKEGAFIETKSVASVGSTLSMRILVDNKMSLDLSGRVLWIADKRGRAANLFPGMGVHFRAISHSDKRILESFLARKFHGIREARAMKRMYLDLKEMASKLFELEEKHPHAARFKKAIDKAINEIDDVAHIIDHEISEVIDL